MRSEDRETVGQAQEASPVLTESHKQAANSLRVQPAFPSPAGHPGAGAVFPRAARRKPWHPIPPKPLICPALSASQVTRRREGDGCGEKSSRKDETLCANRLARRLWGSQSLPAARTASPGRRLGWGDAQLGTHSPFPIPGPTWPCPHPPRAPDLPAPPTQTPRLSRPWQSQHSPAGVRRCLGVYVPARRGQGPGGAGRRDPRPPPTVLLVQHHHPGRSVSSAARLGGEKGADSGRASAGQPVLGQRAGSNYPLVRLLT